MKDSAMRWAALGGVVLVLISCVTAARSPVAASLRAGKPVSGILMGIDAVDYSRHSDTLMMWHYDPLRARVDVLSIPRDTRISLPGYRFNRINEVFAYHYGVKKDPELAALEVMDAVGYLLKMDGEPYEPRYYVQVDYNGFRRFIDLLGGVGVHIDESMHYDDNAGRYHFHKEPGDYHFNGDEALAYVRYRGKSGDRGRILRQMEFLKSMVGKVTSPLLYLRWPRLLATVYSSLHSNLKSWDMLFLALEAKHLRMDRVNPWLLPGQPKGAYWEVDENRAALVLRQVVGGTSPSPDLPAPAAVAPPVKIRAEGRAISVKVWNGTRKEGLALKVARRLRAANFDVLEWGSYGGRQLRTRVMDRVGSIEKAKAVAEVLGVDSVFSDIDPGLRADVEVILGDDYVEKIPMEIPVRK